MQNQTLGRVLLALGVAIALLALFRDAIFPGASAGFGIQQILGVLVGLGLAVVGARMGRRS